MKKRGIGKKGVSKIIEVILLILIVILAIILIWWLLRGYFKEQEEISDLKTKMLVEEMYIDDESVVEEGVNSILLTVTKGPGKQVLTGTTEEPVAPPAVDVVSVVDISGSMLDGTCSVADNECCKNKLCRIKSVCESCTGELKSVKIEGAKQANNVFIDSILQASVNCDVGEDATKKECCKNNKNCFNGVDCGTCGGKWTSKNRVGVVSYGTTACEGGCESLSRDSTSLNNIVNSLSPKTSFPFGSTCICCGIDKAIESLKDSPNIKVIVVMSDGEANIRCSNTDPRQAEFPPYPIAKQEAINKAAESRSEGIIVYSVGFMVDENGKNNLTAIAGDAGRYHDANTINSIVEVYNEIGKKIIQQFETENFAHLKIMVYDKDENSCEKQIRQEIIPGPLESKEYIVTFGTDNELCPGSVCCPAEQTCDCPDISKDNVKRIEIYPVLVTSTGKQVIGDVLDIWENPSFEE